MRRVAVVVARVGAHPRLGPRIAVHRDTGDEPDALEAAVPQVAIQEVGVRVVGDEQIDETVVVVVGRHDAEAVGAGRIGEPVGRGRFHEAAVPDVLEEQIGLAGKPRRADHDARPVAPDERPLRAHDRVPGRIDVARDIQVQVAVRIRVEKGAAGAPAAGRDTRARGDFIEGAVATVAEQEVRPPVGDVEIETPVVVDIPGAHAVAPGRAVHARLLRHVFEFPSSKVAVEGVPVRDALACRRELGGRRQIDVQSSVAVVVEQRDAAAARFQNVVLRRPAAVGPRRKPCGLLERHGRRCTVVGRWSGGRSHAGRVPSVRGLLGFGLAVAALEAHAEGDFSLELDARAFEQRQERTGVDATLRVRPGRREEIGGRAAQLHPQRGREPGRTWGVGCHARIGLGAQRFEPLAGIE